MAYNGLLEFIKHLESNNQLIRIKQFVNPELEITEITDRISKSKQQNKALLFENNGTNFPLLINALGNKERICSALNISDFEQVENDITNYIKLFTSNQESISGKFKTLMTLKKLSNVFPKIVNKKAECQQNIIKNPDLSVLPILKCWPYDGGKFITLPIVHTKDPINWKRNVGMYRMQVFNSTTTGMHWHLHKTGAKHFNEYKKLNKNIPIAVVLGGDPVYTFCASAPLPEGVDEYLLAGFLRKQKVKLVKCITQDIEVPIDADIVIEGYVNPSEELAFEGPFGDHTGFYSLPDYYPKFHVTCITHRNNAVYPATIVGIPPQEDFWMIKASERIFLPFMKFAAIPEILDINMPDFGVAHNLVIVQIKNDYKGQPQKVAHSLWGLGQMMFNKVLIITDSNPQNEKMVLEKILKCDNLVDRIFFSSGPMDVLEHASLNFAYGGKMAIDLTNIIETEDKDTAANELIYNTISENGFINFNKKLLKNKCLVINVLNKKHKDELIEFIKNEISEISIVVICDNNINNNSRILLWHCLANFEPLRDFIYIKNKNIVILDCTSKPYLKQWPNPVFSYKETILKVNKLWEQLGFNIIESSLSQDIYKLIENEGYIKK